MTKWMAAAAAAGVLATAGAASTAAHADDLPYFWHGIFSGTATQVGYTVDDKATSFDPLVTTFTTSLKAASDDPMNGIVTFNVEGDTGLTYEARVYTFGPDVGPSYIQDGFGFAGVILSPLYEGVGVTISNTGTGGYISIDTQYDGHVYGRGYMLSDVSYAGDDAPTLPAPSAPEPTTWALMAAGVGVVGFALRRRQPAAQAAMSAATA